MTEATKENTAEGVQFIFQSDSMGQTVNPMYVASKGGFEITFSTPKTRGMITFSVTDFYDESKAIKLIVD